MWHKVCCLNHSHMQKQRRRFYHIVNVYLGSYKRGRDPTDLQDLIFLYWLSKFASPDVAKQKSTACLLFRTKKKDTSHLYAKVDIHVQAGLPSQFLHTTSKRWMVWSSWNKARKFYQMNSHGSDPIANNGTAPVIRGFPAKCISNYCDSRSVWYTNWWEESWGKGGGERKVGWEKMREKGKELRLRGGDNEEE